MPRYLISFDDGSMDHIPEADQPAVGESAPNKPLKLPSAGFSCAGDPSRGAVQDHDLNARARALAQRPAGHDHAQR